MSGSLQARSLAPGEFLSEPENGHGFTASCFSRPDQPCEWGEPTAFSDRSGLVGQTSVVRCSHCGLGLTRPSLSSVSFLYEGRTSDDFQPSVKGLERALKTLAFRRRAKNMIKHAGIAPRRALDFGCGSGLFTRCLGDLLRECVVGSDFHSEAPTELKDRGYLSNEALSELNGSFDLILALHVLEHDDDPPRLLKRLKSLAADRCVFVFEVPNVDCVWARVFGSAWDAWYIPFHRVHFSRQSLTVLLARQGFSIVREVDVTIPSLGRSFANVSGRSGLMFILLGALLYPLQWIVERACKSPSALRVVARHNRANTGEANP